MSAQVVTDGTVGPALTLVGPNYTIANTLGTQAGANLFHSFSEFNINTGQSVTFTSGFAGVTDHVISRVTGENPSNIDGLLRNSVAGSNFWLVNPNGVMFGPNASLDVPGSFHVTTADFLLLGNCNAAPADCGRFDAANPADSVLTFPPPSVYGFLDDEVGSISVTGATLQVRAGETLALVGRLGTVDRDAGGLRGGLQEVNLYASEGRIDLVSLWLLPDGGAGTVSADHAADQAPLINGFGTPGALAITGSSVDVTGSFNAPGTSGDGGRIFLRGSRIVIDGSQLLAEPGNNEGDAGRIDIDATNFTLTSTAASGFGEALIYARSGFSGPESRITRSDPEYIAARFSAEGYTFRNNLGDAGSVTVRSGGLEVTESGEINVNNREGAGGTVSLFANNILIVDGQASAGTLGNGPGGLVEIGGRDSARGALTPADSFVLSGFNGRVQAESINKDVDGRPGDIAIVARSMRIDEDGAIWTRNTDGNDPTGRRGLIDLQFDDLYLAGGIATQTFGAGPSSDILLRGIGPGLVPANSLTMPGFDATGFLSYIQAGASSEDPRFDTDTISGRPGNITVFVNHIDMDNEAQITNGIRSFGRESNSGFSIDLTALTLTMRNGAFISSSTSGGATAGSVTLDVGTLLLIGTDTRIEASSRGQGDAGDINIRSLATILDGGLLSSTSFGSGDGGSILIETDRLEVVNGGSIDTSSRPELASLIPFTSFDDLDYDYSRAPDFEYSSADGLGPIMPGQVQIIEIGAGQIDRPYQFVARFFDVSPDNLNLTARSNFEFGENVIVDNVNFNDPLVRGVVDTGGAIELEVSGFPDRPLYPFFLFDGEHNQSGNYTVGVQLRPIDVIPPAGDAGSITVRGRGSAGTLATVAPGAVIDSRPGMSAATLQADRADFIGIAGAGSGLFSVSAGDDNLAGAAGNIRLFAEGLDVTDQGVITVTTITGRGGEIELDVRDLRILDRGLISAASTGSGVAGSVRAINAGSITMNNGRIDATAPFSAAGNVELEVSENLFMTDSVISGLSRDPGGNFIVSAPQSLVLKNSQILANSQAAGSGNINITAQAIVIDPDSAVSATGEVFTIGTILANVTQPESPEIIDAGAALDTRCTPQQIDDRSSLIIRTVRNDAAQSKYGLPVEMPWLAGTRPPCATVSALH